MTRAYGFDEATNRTSLAEYGPGAGGSCQSVTAASHRNWSYDSADRTESAGYSLDALGRTLVQPSSDAVVPGTGDIKLTYHVNDMVRSITQGSRTTTYGLDAIPNRVRSWSDSANGLAKVNHFVGDGDSPSWTDEGGGNISRPISGLVGLAGIFYNTTGTVWTIINLHGDNVAGMAESGSGLVYTSEQNEYGQPRNSADVGTRRYGWLANDQRAADAPGGVILMGARVYSPGVGRFLSQDPVYGGNANAYEYCAGNPIGCSDVTGMVRVGKSCQIYKYPAWSCRFTTKYNRLESQMMKWYLRVARWGAGLSGLAVAGIAGLPGWILGAVLWALVEFYGWLIDHITDHQCVIVTGGFGVTKFFVPWSWAVPGTYRC